MKSVVKKSTALLTTPVTTPAVTADQIPTINRLHTEATACAEEARAKANTATQMAIIIGLKLSALKAATPHGQWESLFAGGMKRVGKAKTTHVSHLLEFNIRTAQRYIAVATEIVSRRLTPEQAQALQHIASCATLTPADSTFLEEVTPAETLRQLYLEMGIIKPTKKELHAMTHPLNEKKEKEEKETPLTPAQRMAQKRDEARAYWFGTPKPDSIAPSFLMAIQQELNQPEKGRLHYLSKDDIHTMEDLVSQLSKRLKKLKTEIS